MRPARPKMISRSIVAAVALCALTGTPLRAQVSANDQLDKCMRDAAVGGAAIGGGIGALVGGLLGDRARTRLNSALGGAAVGAAVGAIAAWQSSYKSCSARFATASSLITDEYSACAGRVGYARAGTRVELEPSALPAEARGGQRLETDVRYHVLTPDPKDVPVQLTRRFLCKDEQGVFNELASPTESITVAAGCHVSHGTILLPSRIPAEQQCRIDVSLSAEGETRTASSDFRILP